MPIILQVTAWTILAVGMLALGYKFFPNFKQWFTTGKVSYVWLIAIILGLFVLLTYPYFFNWWAVNFWNVPEGELTDLTKLGPLGDIYGSLNTIFTSATLAFVVYATFLQRQANIDARIAMDKQLQQAQKSATAQLREARRSTKEQLIQAKYALRAQLKQAEESTKQQLALAQASHDAQIRESQNAIFTTKFYGLLNFKNERLNSLKLKSSTGIILVGYEIFSPINQYISKSCFSKYGQNLKELEPSYIRQEFDLFCCEHNNNNKFYEIFSYFELYSSLLDLIKTAPLETNVKNFYWSLIRNSMTSSEQLSLFYLAPIWDRLYISLLDSFLFNSFAPSNGFSKEFAIKFYKKNHFYTEEWFQFFEQQ